MRTFWVLLGIVALTGISFGQGIMPGTFNTPVQTVPYAPVLSPPIATLGNGLTPTMVTNRPMIVMAGPQDLSAEATTGATATQAAEPTTNQPTARARYFDFVVSSAESSDVGVDQSQSLADVARSTRKNAPPVAGRKITNDDINQLNQKYGNRPANPQAPPAVPGVAPPQH